MLGVCTWNGHGWTWIWLDMYAATVCIYHKRLYNISQPQEFNFLWAEELHQFDSFCRSGICLIQLSMAAGGHLSFSSFGIYLYLVLALTCLCFEDEGESQTAAHIKTTPANLQTWSNMSMLRFFIHVHHSNAVDIRRYKYVLVLPYYCSCLCTLRLKQYNSTPVHGFRASHVPNS